MHVSRKAAASRLCAALCLLGASAAHTAHAQPIEVVARGTVTSFDTVTSTGDSVPGKGEIDSTVNVGTPVNWTFFFDDTAPGTPVPGNPNTVQYILNGPSYGTTVTIGDYTVTPGANTASYLQPTVNDVQSGGTFDDLFLISYHPKVTNPGAAMDMGFMRLSLFDGSNTTLSSTAFPPLGVYNLSKWADTRQFWMQFGPQDGSNNTFITANVTSLSAFVVAPEPGIGQFACAGLVAALPIAVTARRRRGSPAQRRQSRQGV